MATTPHDHARRIDRLVTLGMRRERAEWALSFDLNARYPIGQLDIDRYQARLAADLMIERSITEDASMRLVHQQWSRFSDG